MKLIIPMAMTDATLAASNVTEDDADEWDAGTTYATAEQVIVLATHKVYESAAGSNLGYDPTTDDGTWWFEVGATNRWKAFDQKLADPVTKAGTVTYRVTVDSLVTGIAFFGLEASEIRVQVTDTGATETYDTTLSLVDDSEIVDWFSFFTTELDSYQTQALFVDLAAYVGYAIDLTIGDGIGTVEVGQIVLGRVVTLGTTLEDTTVGLTSFSTKEQDTFGNWTIVPRAKSDPVNYRFSMPATGAARTQRWLNSRRDAPTVYFASEDIIKNYGVMTYGLFQDYEIPLRKAGVSIVNLEIEGLT
ncbi:hypothetical protein [Pseudooceanicola nanhaiensis]|uniref:hypothetical protein n=1 Tax=Pseudooceanicola nanhaiensis TaxID=375761 RepID=UPI001CD6A6EE|nr:hypothetical protein [Pseudooceanicola nanhaiensis]MCA0920220.1 hypothetical protein [Pseudooceanicola nanhaiensis]